MGGGNEGGNEGGDIGGGDVGGGDVGEEPENELEITLEQARAIRAKAQIGDVIRFDVETKKFGRIAAQAANAAFRTRGRAAE